MLKDPPVEAVNETPATVALKERRLVLGGGANGIIRSVRRSAALLPGPPGSPDVPIISFGRVHDA